MNNYPDKNEQNLLENKKKDSSSEEDEVDDEDDSVSSETSSSYESQECIILHDEDPSRMQKTVIVSGTNLGLFRKSEILDEKNYDSAEERPIEEEPFPVVFGNSIAKEVDLATQGKFTNSEIFFEQDIEKVSDSSDKNKNTQKDPDLGINDGRKVKIVEEKDKNNEAYAKINEEKVKANEKNVLISDRSGNIQAREAEPYLNKSPNIEKPQNSNKNTEKQIKNSLTEIVRSQSMSKKAKSNNKGAETCSNCRII